jgi:hypothetical protein
VDDLHKELGHPYKAITQAQATSKALNLKVICAFKPCEELTIDKTR